MNFVGGALELPEQAVQPAGLRHSSAETLAALERQVLDSRIRLEATPVDHMDHPGTLATLAGHLADHFALSGIIEHMQESVELLRRATEISPLVERSDDARVLGNHDVYLWALAMPTGDGGQLNEAIFTVRLAIHMTPDTEPYRYRLWIALGVRLGDRFNRYTKDADLEESIASFRRGLETAPPEHPDRSTITCNLAIQLLVKFTRGGAMQGLDEALALMHGVIKIMPDNHPKRTMRVKNYSLILRERVIASGDCGPPEKEIEMVRDALLTSSRGSLQHLGQLDGLSKLLITRYSRDRKPEDLHLAIRASREAVDACPTDYFHRPALLNSLASHLGVMYAEAGQMADLEDAIGTAWQAWNAIKTQNTEEGRILFNLAMLLTEKFKHTKAEADLSEAIDVMMDAVNAIPAADPDLCTRFTSLGYLLLTRDKRTETWHDLAKARECAVLGLSLKMSPILDRVAAGRLFLRLTTVIDNAAEGYMNARATANLLPLAISRALRNSDKQSLISEAVGLACDAAAMAQHCGRGPETLELLEMGRGVIVSCLSGLQPEIALLESKYPLVVKTFKELRGLYALPITEDGLITGGFRLLQAMRRNMAEKNLGLLLEQIHLVPGFERFLLPPSRPDMHKAAAEGPVVMLNVSRYYLSSAIIIMPHETRTIELHKLSVAVMNRDLPSFSSTKGLEWLWDYVVQPILHQVGFTKIPQDNNWPRIWWIPTGPLVGAPLHAAGYHFHPKAGMTALDNVVSSYSSSIKMIIHGRERAQRKREALLKHQEEMKQQGKEGRSGNGTDKQKLVLVSTENTPARERLPNTVGEIQAVREIARQATSVPFSEAVPRKDPVLQALRLGTMFHFVGHGGVPSSDIFKGSLLLEDWEDNCLTVESLMNLNPGSEVPLHLAYISACGTCETCCSSKTTNNKPDDEMMPLASVFQITGFQHSIGTLWNVEDETRGEMAKRTYKAIFEGGIDDDAMVSKALHHATRELRDEWIQAEKDRKEGETDKPQEGDGVADESALQGLPSWVSYVHYGI